MAMPVVRIREVRVRMHKRLVPMPMTMPRSGRHRTVMRVQVVLVVHMLMTVFQGRMRMAVFMALA